ncbi:hypothetical protein RDI58_003690 [Solanum bulbocastanum]|uniref:Uncharacterized protein n=1 Tax=Solanum bulbocastanum TaxID=147425 RepID=A0AAN8YS63_SOLBU
MAIRMPRIIKKSSAAKDVPKGHCAVAKNATFSVIWVRRRNLNHRHQSKGSSSTGPKLQISAENENRLRWLSLNSGRSTQSPALMIKKLRSINEKLSCQGFSYDQLNARSRAMVFDEIPVKSISCLAALKLRCEWRHCTRAQWPKTINA